MLDFLVSNRLKPAMVTVLTKKILEHEDIMALQPNFEYVKQLPKEIAEKAQTVVFDGEKSRVMLLTTNENNLAVQSITDQLAAK